MSDSPAIVWIEKDELDRLRAENGDHLAWIEHLKAENRALNEMLDAEKRAVAKAVKAVTAENERLRDALCNIAGLGNDMPNDAALYASDILSSTAQEPPCQPQD